MRKRPILLAVAVFLLGGRGLIRGQCPEEPTLQNFEGPGTVVCPCFIVGEEAGAIFQAPPEDYPLEILRVGIGWGSQFGGTPDSLEGAIKIYEGGLPDPGAPIFELPGPVLVDGFINEFDLEPIAGEIVIDSGPFLVSLAFANDSPLPFGPSVVHDGDGCDPGENVVFVLPNAQWFDACSLGVSGDWIFQVVYRKVSCGPAGEELVRGDTNTDGDVNIGDAIFALAYLFQSGPGPCLDALDSNDDGGIDVSDAIFLLNFLFASGAQPPEPFPGCGEDSTPDPGGDLGCASFPPCP